MRWFCASFALVLILDLITKEMALRSLHWPGHRIPVLPGFFDLHLQFNRGAAFSFMYDYPAVITVFSLLALSVIFVWSFRIPEKAVAAHLALGALVGGGIGNLIDRFRYGYVVDFLQLYYRSWSWPTFNAADTAITIGIGVIILLLIFTRSLDAQPYQDGCSAPPPSAGPKVDEVSDPA